MSIPKILHYSWFGNGNMPKAESKCVKRWNKFFSHYEIRKWDESNFDVNCNRYVKEAYENKRYCYVSDYARLLALYEYGGLYLDADCYVKKPFDELLENSDAFTGFGGDNAELSSCTMAFTKGHPFIKECLDSYKDDKFLLEDGSFNLLSINQRMTKLLINHGFCPNGKKQEVMGITIYPMTYFCPLSMLPDTVKDCKSKNTYSMALWTNPELKRERSFIVRISHKLKLNVLKRKVFKR
jgi:hypothetical protein